MFDGAHYSLGARQTFVTLFGEGRQPGFKLSGGGLGFLRTLGAGGEGNCSRKEGVVGKILET
jgi:hypothetical protein